MDRRTVLRNAMVGAGALWTQMPSIAQGWPTRTVRVIVPYAAGSVPDALARSLFDKVQQSTGGTFVVENKVGAAGMIGTDLVAKARPDGHTLVVAPSGPLVTNALLYRKMPYDPIKDIEPVAQIAETLMVLVTANSVAATDIRSLLGEMASDRKMSYASPGNGTLGHLAMAYLVSRSGVHVPHAAYPGSPQIITALMAGDIHAAVLAPPAVAPFVNAGKIKALAIVGPRRNRLFPAVPTLKEQGVDFDPVAWFGVATTAGTPKTVIEEMHRSINAGLQSPDVQRAYMAQGLDMVRRTPDQFKEYIQRELEGWAPVIKANGIVLD